jgi:alpha-L-fucosidase
MDRAHAPAVSQNPSPRSEGPEAFRARTAWWREARFGLFVHWGLTEGDYSTPEQAVPPAPLGQRLWESCLTMNDDWGFSRTDQNWKSAEDLIRRLSEIAGKGGNLLLNVGPDGQGRIPDASVERLSAIGRWMKRHGEGLRGTTQGPFRRLRFEGSCTARGSRLFLHVFRWPPEGVQVAGLKTAVKEARFLEDGTPAGCTTTVEEDGIPVLGIRPPARPDPAATVVVLELAGPPEVGAHEPIPAGPGGDLLLRAADADLHGGRAYSENAYGEDTVSY